ncbi:MAG: peptidase caspase catalytic subunit p20 [Alphaproteobacteria bacterium]|nr:peptidase caspase catalytic subunit p20 [Alphaproteobacteria bacterium]
MRAAALLIATAISLSLSLPAAAQPNRPARPILPLAAGQSHSGELTPLDTQRRSGKYEDVFRIDGRRGQRLELILSSDDFDPYLVVTGPGGYVMSNDDDGRSQTLNSRLVIELPEDGSYRVSATSFSPGAMGAYRLAAATPSAGERADSVQPASAITLGSAVNGRLDRDDLRVADDKFHDRYRLTGRRGERVRISVASPDFDTVLNLQGPDGTTQSNDDSGDGGNVSTNSRIDTVLAEDGDYVVSVTSFAANATGKYRLSVEPGTPNPRHAGVQAGPRVLAVAVGVSDYERISDLPHTDGDATELLASLRQNGLLHPQSIALTNAEATTQAVRAALQRAARAAGPNDLVMFFFSGHGDQVDVQRSARELDGRAETIELYDAAMTDSELQPLIDGLGGRMVLVAIDACYSGGFRNLVNRPNVMGLFSSEEDLTSLVAARLEAGGYLSYYLRTGLSGEADQDGDRVISAGELATYLRRNFRLEGDIPASTREDESNYQYLLVERGGIHVDDGVVRLGAPAQAAIETAPAASKN